MEKKLNLEIAKSVSEFEGLIRKVLPKNIFYQVVYGKGLEFDGYRDFQTDEDSGNIDWKATVRAGKTLARKYIEERDLKIFFLIDSSDNMVFGSTEKLKCEYAAEMVAALAHVILLSGDRVGFSFFNNKIIKFREPGFGDRQFSILEQELSNPLNYGGESNLDISLNDLINQLDPKTSLVFIVSDFLNLTKESKETLNAFSGLFETIALVVRDPLDLKLPEINKEIIISGGQGQKLLVNPKLAGNIYEQHSLIQLSFMKQIFRNAGIDFMEFNTSDHFAINLAEFLGQRTKKRGYKKQDVH
jgi:uncharacterized protein (DUF58 family)